MDNIITVAAIIFLALGSLLLLCRQGIWNFALRILPDLIVEAEKSFGAGKGEEKLASVLSKLQNALPAFLRPLLTKERAQALAEEVLSALRELGEITDREDAA